MRTLLAVLAGLVLLAQVACGGAGTTIGGKKDGDSVTRTPQDAGSVEDTSVTEDTGGGAPTVPVDAGPDVGIAGNAPCKALTPDFDCCCSGGIMTKPVCLNGKWSCAEPIYFKEYKGLACQGLQPGACGG